METITFFTSTLAILLSSAATMIAFHAYRAQTDPNVIVYLEPDAKRPSIMLLIIENIGAGVAYDIQFSLPDGFPESLFDRDTNLKNMSNGPLISGIQSLPPKAQRIMSWGQANSICEYMEASPKEIVIEFKRKYGPYLHQTSFYSVSILEIDSFLNTDISKTSIEAHLKDISDHLRKISQRSKN